MIPLQYNHKYHVPPKTGTVAVEEILVTGSVGASIGVLPEGGVTTREQAKPKSV